MKQPFLLLLGTLLLFSACRKSSPAGHDTVSVELEQCVQKTYGNEKLTLCFDDLVGDSRCPIDAVCVWQGVAQVQLTLQLHQQSHTFELATSTVLSFRTDTTIGQYRFTLRSVKPYPGETTTTKPVAEIDITCL